ncbi:MAG: site-specific DNA-methyltransferase, partial [Anaerolineales bacterium]|nr:site-specific DNA-methyltransferase [Anaerolineales bacterium]
ADGWYLRQDIIWHKPNPMPESVTDRCTKAHEYIFLLSKSKKYYYDNVAIMEDAVYAGESRGGSTNRYEQNNAGMDNKEYDKKNKRSVWKINTQPYKEAHFAVFPPKLPELCIKAGSSEGDIVLDPFFGSGTTGWVAQRLGRKWIGIELNEEYIKIAEKRFAQQDMFK